MLSTIIQNYRFPYRHEQQQLMKRCRLARFRNYGKGSTTSVAEPVPIATVYPPLPQHVDLSDTFFHSILPYDQGCIAASASAAMANNMDFLLWHKTNSAPFRASRLALYYNTRVYVEGCSTDEDNGVRIGNMCKAVNNYQLCTEDTWPYHVASFGISPPVLVRRASGDQGHFSSVQLATDIYDIKRCLTEQSPVLVDVRVYESFESIAADESGILPIPKVNERFLGIHTLLLMGYDDSTRTMLALNSFGVNWGMQGFCLLPFEYMPLVIDVWLLYIPSLSRQTKT